MWQGSIDLQQSATSGVGLVNLTWGETRAKKRSPVKYDRALNLRRRILDVFDVQDSTLVLYTDNVQIANLVDEGDSGEGLVRVEVSIDRHNACLKLFCRRQVFQDFRDIPVYIKWPC